MKKLVVGLLAALALGSFMNEVRAQGTPASYYSPNQGQPNFCANSVGANYGCIQNNAANSWQLGYGTSLTTNGTAAATWDNTPAFTANVPFVTKQTQFGTGSGTAFGIYGSSTIPVANTSGTSFDVLIASNSAIVMTATPTISTMNAQGAAIAGGTWLVLSSTAGTITLQDGGSLSGSLLRTFTAANVVVSSNSTVSFIFNSIDGFWHQIAR